MRFIRGEILKEAIQSSHKRQVQKGDPGPRSLALAHCCGGFSMFAMRLTMPTDGALIVIVKDLCRKDVNNIFARGELMACKFNLGLSLTGAGKRFGTPSLP